MFEKLRMLLISFNLVLFKSLSLNHRMHNLHTKIVRILEICKLFSHNLVNAKEILSAVALFLDFQTWMSWRCRWRQTQKHRQ